MGPYLQKLHDEHKARKERFFTPAAPQPVVPVTPKPEPPPKPLPPVLDVLITLAAGRYNVAPGTLLTNRRVSDMVDARHVVIYILRFFCGWTHPGIACWFHMDPSSMVYAIQQVGRNLSKERAAHEIWNALPDELKVAAKEEGLRMASVEAENARKPKVTDWKVVAEELARENERLRVCLRACGETASMRTRVVMLNGMAMDTYVRQALANAKGTDHLNFKESVVEKPDGGKPANNADGRDAGLPGAPGPEAERAAT